MIKKKHIFVLGVILGLIFLAPHFCLAQGTDAAVGAVDDFIKDVGSEMITESNPNVIVGEILSKLMGIIGTIALLIFLYSGIMWMMSEGEAAKLKKAQRTMIWASIGMAAVFLSYFGVMAVINYYKGALFGGG